MNILLTGVGAPGTKGTIHCLKSGANPYDSIKIIGTDVNPEAVGRHFVDEFRTLPWPEDSTYLDELEKILVEFNVDVILPQTTREVAELARSKFWKDHAMVATSAPHVLHWANNKGHLFDIASIHLKDEAPDFKYAMSAAALKMAAKKLGYPDKPVAVKPPVSHGSRGFRILREGKESLHEFLNDKEPSRAVTLERFMETVWTGFPFPHLVVMEYLPGDEYTVDCFRGDRGFVGVVRRRNVIRSGITFEAEVVDHPQILEAAERMSAALGLGYAFGYQFKEDENGVPKLLECNPRVQGTMVASLVAGLNCPWLAVSEVLERGGAELPVPRKSGKLQRYWGAVGDGVFV